MHKDANMNAPPAPAPNMVSRSELEQKVTELQQQFSTAMGSMEQKLSTSVQGIEQQVCSTVRGAQASTQKSLEQVANAMKSHEERIDKLDEQVQRVSNAAITKVDLSAILAEALAKQTSDFQRMLAKRPGDPSPSNDSNKAPKQI